MKEKIKVLNLYAGIGGNRKFWQNVEVTAVENKKIIAGIYSHFFPEDKVIIGDAHQYLLNHYKEFDFIWSSPPLPDSFSHAKDLFSKGKHKAGLSRHATLSGNSLFDASCRLQMGGGKRE